MIPESIDFVAAAVEQGAKLKKVMGQYWILDLAFLEYIYFVQLDKSRRLSRIDQKNA